MGRNTSGGVAAEGSVPVGFGAYIPEAGTVVEKGTEKYLRSGAIIPASESSVPSHAVQRNPLSLGIGTTIFTGIAYDGAGVYVACGNGRFIYRSTDAINWTKYDVGFNPISARAVYGLGKFVVTAFSGAIFCSPEGKEWTKAVSALGTCRVACVGPDRFVAFGSANGQQSAYSMDGLTWTLGGSVTVAVAHAVYGAGRYVAAGDNGIYHSTDGITWTLGAGTTGQNWSGVAFADGKFVAVSSTANTTTAVSSVDGITWTLRTIPAVTSDGYYSVAYGNGYWLATTSSASVAYSNNGESWTALALPTGVYAGYTTLFAEGYFITGSLSAEYANGSLSFRVSNPSLLSSYEYYTGTLSAGHSPVRQYNGVTLSLSNPGYAGTYLIYSTDSEIWQQAILPVVNVSGYTAFYPMRAAYANGYYVVTYKRADGASHNKYARSADLVTWEILSFPGNAGNWDLISTPAGFLAHQGTTTYHSANGGTFVSKQGALTYTIPDTISIFRYTADGVLRIGPEGAWGNALNVRESGSGLEFTTASMVALGTSNTISMVYKNGLCYLLKADGVYTAKSISTASSKITSVTFPLNAKPLSHLVCLNGVFAYITADSEIVTSDDDFATIKVSRPGVILYKLVDLHDTVIIFTSAGVFITRDFVGFTKYTPNLYMRIE